MGPKCDEKTNFAPILFAIRSRCISEDSKKMKKTFAKKRDS